jgi:DNA-binding NarL/FixJ family response regulator
VIKVLIVDDQELVRAGFGVLVESADDLVVVGTAANGAEGVALAAATSPDVVLMDIRMPVMNGLEATARILAAPGAAGAAGRLGIAGRPGPAGKPGSTSSVGSAGRPGVGASGSLDMVGARGLAAVDGRPGWAGTRVLILTTFDLDEYVFGALRAGASGFLLKDTRPADLLAGIRIVARGDALLSPSITRHLIEEFVKRPQPGRVAPAALQSLTEREVEVLALVARGLSNSEIGHRLHVSPATAKTHVARLLMKLEARDRAQLIIVAYETGLVTPQES